MKLLRLYLFCMGCIQFYIFLPDSKNLAIDNLIFILVLGLIFGLGYFYFAVQLPIYLRLEKVKTLRNFINVSFAIGLLRYLFIAAAHPPFHFWTLALVLILISCIWRYLIHLVVRAVSGSAVIIPLRELFLNYILPGIVILFGIVAALFSAVSGVHKA